MRAREIGLQENVDFVIGIGGGSPLDASKAIALMIANPEANEDVLYQANPLPYLPVVCVPTTCGTGSEVTPYAILTLHKQRTKKSISHKIYPTLALLDTKYLKTASREGLVNTSVDALAHLVESYLNTNSNCLNRIYSEQGLRVWAEFKNRLKENTLTEDDYVKMLHASMIAGMAITHTGTSLPHGLSYPVTYELGVPHGKAVGMFLGGYVENYKDEKEAGKVLQLLGFADAKEFRQYLHELLGTVEVSDELLEKDAEGILANPGKLKNYPFAVTKEELLGMAN
jgi:alcohol dehydrogenase